jgi:hypothetical protein
MKDNKPIQLHNHSVSDAGVPTPVYMKAYEVYCALYGPQKALIEDGCRGGFGIGELVAFLYAASFPKDEWRKRVDEAFKGMRLTP